MAGGNSSYTQKTETVFLNDYEGSSASKRVRTSKITGKTSNPRFSFEIKSEPIVHVFDDEALGRGPAEALKRIIGDQIRAIKEPASTSTQLNRKYSQKAFNENTMNDWDEKRYAGGRIGALEPNQTHYLFNDSGRLGGNLAVGKNRQAAGERDWVVNMPANRFTDRPGHPNTVHLIHWLAKLVPALGDPKTLQNNRVFRAAVDESIDLIITKARNASDARRKALMLKRKNYQRKVAQALIGLARTVTGI